MNQEKLVYFDFIRFELFEFIYSIHSSTQELTIDIDAKIYTICRHTHASVYCICVCVYIVEALSDQLIRSALSSTLCICRHMHAITARILCVDVHEKEEKQRERRDNNNKLNVASCDFATVDLCTKLLAGWLRVCVHAFVLSESTH